MGPPAGLPALTPDGLAIHNPDFVTTQQTELVDPASGLVVRRLPWLSPLFSPDGHWVAYADRGTLYVVPADGSAAAVPIATIAVAPFTLVPLAWSPDGSRLAFETSEAGTPGDLTLEVIGRDGSGQSRIFTAASGFYVSWLPDGTRFLFDATPRGQGEPPHVYVAAGGGGACAAALRRQRHLKAARLTERPLASARPDARAAGRAIYQTLLIRTNGSTQRVLRGPRDLEAASWLPDGKLLASTRGPARGTVSTSSPAAAPSSADSPTAAADLPAPRERRRGTSSSSAA